MIKRNISGILILDKPYGISSNKALQIVKYSYKAAKSGHTGTLDPMATGVLPICLGEATKFSSYLLNAHKSYEAVLKLGFISTTGDLEGEIKEIPCLQAQKLTIENCETVLRQFIGEIEQLPPMYSALKYQGKPLYTYARRGEAIERKSRSVFIHDIQAKSMIGNELTIEVLCGTGTYIRTLAEDIGKALGCGGAYLIRLCRNSVGQFNLSQSTTLEALEGVDMANRDGRLLPIDSMLSDIPSVELDKKESQHISQGRIILIDRSMLTISGEEIDCNNDQDVRLYYDQQFLGLGELSADFQLKPKRLLSESYLSACLDRNKPIEKIKSEM